MNFLEQGILLQRPEDCPSTVYHVMLGCWKKDPKERLAFDRLIKYLEEYRNRLIKVSYTHQQNSSIVIDVSAVLQNEHSETRSIHNKGAVVSDTLISSREVNSGTLNYLTLACSKRTYKDDENDNSSLFDQNGSSIEKEKNLSISHDGLNVCSSLTNSLKDNLSLEGYASRVSETADFKQTCKTDLVSGNIGCLKEDVGSGIQSSVVSDKTNLDTKKLPANRFAPCSLINHTGKFCRNHNSANKRYGSLKQVSLKPKTELLETNLQNHLSASALELCPRVTCGNQNISLLIHYHHVKSGHQNHPKCANIHHKTNKVTDRSPLPDHNWKVKCQTARAKDVLPSLGCLTGNLDSQSACNLPQREVATNYYSSPSLPSV